MWRWGLRPGLCVRMVGGRKADADRFASSKSYIISISFLSFIFGCGSCCLTDVLFLVLPTLTLPLRNPGSRWDLTVSFPFNWIRLWHDRVSVGDVNDTDKYRKKKEEYLSRSGPRGLPPRKHYEQKAAREWELHRTAWRCLICAQIGSGIFGSIR